VYAGVGSLAVVAAAGTVLLVRQTDPSACFRKPGATRWRWWVAAGTVLLVQQTGPSEWLEDIWGEESKLVGLPMPGIGEDGERRRQREAEATSGEEAETAARPEVALPRAEAQDLATADSAYKRGDYATVLQLMRPLADAGNTRAQTYLGVLYDNGQGVPQDDAQAVVWYRKAADQGDARAQTNLGAAYETGRGVARGLGASG